MGIRPSSGRAVPLVCAIAMAGLAACDAPVTHPAADELEVAPPSFSHGTFTMSTGIYRIPYVDGSTVTVTRDHHNHSPRNRIDMAGDEANYLIVAAASGTIRAVVDWHGSSPFAGDGVAADGVTSQDDTLEHSCQDAMDGGGNAIPNSVVTGVCSQHNNYVWIEHPNGEWTKYTHFGTGTVSANGWNVGDWVEAGEVLGTEGDVGFASGRHLHFEVGLPDDPTALAPFTTLGGFMVPNFGVNLVPRICDIDNNLFVANEVYVAAPCSNVAPVAEAGGPYVVAEGSSVLLDGTGSVDPDGLPLTFVWTPGDALDNASLAQPTFTGVDDGAVDLVLTVFDRVEALWDSDQTTVTVFNVAPSVTIAPDQTTVIEEGTTLQVSASFSDPGVLDAPFTASVRCYEINGSPYDVVGTVTVTDTEGPLTGTVSATCPFGDTSQSGNPATGTFQVTVTVADKDGGEGQASFQVTVTNTAPAVQIDGSGATDINGVPTFLGSLGENIAFSAAVTDKGSDDLFLTWNWGDGTQDQSAHLLNPPTPDPFPSPGVNPRNIVDLQSHAWTGACLFDVTLTAQDDDGGQSSASAKVLIPGNSGRARGAGYWLPQYRNNRSSGLSAETLGCYLAIAGHMSAVFDEVRGGTGSFAEAADVLHTGGSKGEISQELDQQLLAVWLNFANGAFGWTDLVDTTGNGVADTPFNAAITQAESVRLDPNATPAQLEAQKNVLEAINLVQGG